MYEKLSQSNDDTEWDILTKMPDFNPDETFDREKLPSNISVEKLSATDNLGQAGEAIYLTDQYICPDFFGDKERAKQFAEILFSDDPNVLFSYDKTLVAKDEDGNIAGILVYRDADCKPWDADAMEAKFKTTGIEMPENFDRANRIYMPKITGEMMPGTAELEFVGVRDDYRSQNVGKKMMQTLIDNPDYHELHLDVLDSHPWASKSYSVMGFRPEGEKFGNYPDSTEGVQHMILRKRKTN